LQEDITVLKDDPTLPDHLQPTRANFVEHPLNVLACISVSADRMYHVRQIHELKQLVSGAAPGDKFTFLCMYRLLQHLKKIDSQFGVVDSGHSDQQLSFDDIEDEEDGQDEGMSSHVLH
jgi:hypothetical protein